MASPNFTINGFATPPELAVAYTSTVTLALTSTSGVNSVAWSIAGTSSPSVVIPTITPGGSPLGATSTFTAGADPGTGIGISYLVQCVVNGGRDSANQVDPSLTKTAVVGVQNAVNIVPFSVGETDERSSTHGWTPTINKALGASAGVVNARFFGTFHVDPNSTAPQTGSESNPYTSIAAAFTAAVASSSAGGLIVIPPMATITENVVFPAGGGDWEIGCLHTSRNATISGTVTCTVTGNTPTTPKYRLTNLTVTGAVSGDAHSFATILFLTNAKLNSTLTLSATTGGSWSVYTAGHGAQSANALTGSVAGACSVAGIIEADGYTFASTIGMAYGGAPARFSDCRLLGAITVTAAVPCGLQISNCTLFGVSITGVSSTVAVLIDGESLGGAILGVTVSGTATLNTANANSSSVGSVVGNVSSTAIAALSPPGLYRFAYDLTQLVAGTAGTMQVNVIYTDIRGTLVTAPVGGTLAVTAAAGTKASGNLDFHSNGATAIALSLTGVTTAGSLSASLIAAVSMSS